MANLLFVPASNVIHAAISSYFLTSFKTSPNHYTKWRKKFMIWTVTDAAKKFWSCMFFIVLENDRE